jgi:hypothetical protein
MKYLSIIIGILLVVLFFQQGGCGYVNFGHKKSDTTIVHDTTWEVHDSLIIRNMTTKGKIIHDTTRTPPEYLADTNYARLKIQYDELLKKFLALTVYSDTLKLDTLGYIAIADTVKENQLKNRSYDYKYKIPTITNTITIQHYEKPKSMVFIGGGVDANKTIGVTGASLGLLLKNKKDHIYGLNVGTQINGAVSYGFQSYWKIKVK